MRAGAKPTKSAKRMPRFSREFGDCAAILPCERIHTRGRPETRWLRRLGALGQIKGPTEI
jgi:hypothetical protein